MKKVILIGAGPMPAHVLAKVRAEHPDREIVVADSQEKVRELMMDPDVVAQARPETSIALTIASLPPLESVVGFEDAERAERRDRKKQDRLRARHFRKK